MFKEDPNHVSRHANKLSQSSTSNKQQQQQHQQQQATPMPKSLENVFFNIKNNSETIKNTSSNSSSGGGYTNLLSLYTNPNETKEEKPKTQEEIERDITNRQSDDFLRDNNIFIE